MKTQLERPNYVDGSRATRNRMWRPLMTVCLFGMVLCLLGLSYRYIVIERQLLKLSSQLRDIQLCRCHAPHELQTTVQPTSKPTTSPKTSADSSSSSTGGGTLIFIQFLNQLINSGPQYFNSDQPSSEFNELDDEKPSFDHSNENVTTSEEIEKLRDLVENDKSSTELNPLELLHKHQNSLEDTKPIYVDDTESQSHEVEIEPEYPDVTPEVGKDQNLDYNYHYENDDEDDDNFSGSSANIKSSYGSNFLLKAFGRPDSRDPSEILYKDKPRSHELTKRDVLSKLAIRLKSKARNV